MEILKNKIMPENISLESSLDILKRIGPTVVSRFKKLGVKTIKDLIFYYPTRYDDFSKIVQINKLTPSETATVKGKIISLANRQSYHRRMIITEAIVGDPTGSIKAVWFNQPFLIKILYPGNQIYLSGKPDYYSGLFQFTNPSYEKIQGMAIHTARLVPIYPSTENLTQKQIRWAIKLSLALLKEIKEWLPPEIIKKLKLLSLPKALAQIHFPQNNKLLTSATYRLKFDELFLLQLKNLSFKKELDQQKAPIVKFKEKQTKDFVKKICFPLTNAQRKTSWEILKDLEKGHPMNRLLEGDVGSGKTVVATIALLNTVLNKYQAVVMAPTEILAQQHFKTISQLLSKFPKKIALLTRTEKKINKLSEKKNTTRSDKKFNNPAVEKSSHIKKSELIKQIASGKIDIIIGTHALLQEKVKFKNLALIIVDEQHRFGVEQRAGLLNDTKNTNRSKTTNISESTKTDKIIEKELSYKLGGIFFKVQKELGKFCRERQYSDALEKEFGINGINFRREYPVKIADRKSNFIDFIIEEKILIEVKTKPFIEKNDYYQMKRYLETTGLELGLIVNFRDKYLKPKRVLNTKKFVDSDKFAVSDRISDQLPHFLSMTATPIPRSLALTFFGDLDLSIIDEMPPGRKKIITKIVSPKDREKAYNFLRGEIKKGRQVFVICPLIDPSDKLGVKAVKIEYEKLKKEVFPDISIGLLHGKLKNKEKEKMMKDFLENKTKILVSTLVIEVGIDIPNASLMMIEGAERFGLAQLYQLRGRVGRSFYQSYCFIFTENEGEKTKKRLEALIKAKNGFELAEKDLEIRGPGELYGLKQSGYLKELKIASLSDQEILSQSKKIAQEIFTKDPFLANYPSLKEKISQFSQDIHLE